MSDRPDKILVIGPSWVGDMVMSQPLYTLLQQTRPGAIIDVLAPAWSEPILARMPEVNRSLSMPVGHGELGLGKRWRIARELSATGYDQAVVLPNSLKSALIPFIARIPLRTGWLGEQRYGLLNDIRRLDAGQYPLMVQRFAALGLAPDQAIPKPLSNPALQVDLQSAHASAERMHLSLEKPILALCPGAEFGGAKCWPALHYAQLADAYTEQGWRVVIFGSANDASVAKSVLASSARPDSMVDLTGKTSLDEAVDLLSLAHAVVSNDSGLMHIAAALGVPTVVIYGPTSPDFTPPLSKRATVLASEIDCAPCFQRECPLGHHGCMSQMPVQRVAEALDELLAGAA
ncbi:MAG: lipopolysaccharide heptosyltransferase II [Halioglobus sp.]